MIKQTQFQPKNVALLVVVAALGVGLLAAEGYLSLVRWPFVLYVAGVTCAALWYGGFELRFKRLAWMVVVAGASGFLTQVVGADHQGAWEYQGPHGTYYFVPTMFAFAATFAYGLTVLVVGPHVRHVLRFLPRWPGALFALVVFGVTVVLSAPYRQGSAGPAFWVYYVALGLFAVYASTLMDLATLLSLVLAAVFVGFVSESLGAASGVWRFRGEPGWLPPAYLVLGSWPLEIILHYGLSGVLAGESLLARPRVFQEDVLYREDAAHPMHVGKVSAKVASVVAEDKFEALDRVLELTGFFDVIARRERETGKDKATLKIIIKPNLMFMYSEEDRSTFTDPALVEHLVDRLREKGYADIAVVEAQSAYGNFFLDREVPNVAKIVGYDPKGRYRIVDLTAEKVAHTFKGPLGEHVVGPTWRDADVRVSFAKNKTHTWAWYTLTIKNIYGALAMQDKIGEYHYKRELYYPTIDMLVDFPVHFGLIDAYTSADGPFGIFADRHPNPTKTVLGGENLLAVDWVGAQKMGLDPMVSRYMQLAVQAFGKPEPEILGDASRYEPWENVPKKIIDFWDHAEESYTFTNTVFSILNHDYMSPAFRRRPMTRLVGKLSRLLSPLGGFVYRTRREQPGDRAHSRKGTEAPPAAPPDA